MSGGGHGHAESGSSGESALGKYLKPFANITAGGDELTKVLNADENAVSFNAKRRAEAAKEMSPEISTTVSAIKAMIGSIVNTVKTTVKVPLIAATDIITNTVAIPANIARGIWDRTMKVLAVAHIAVANIIPEKTFGKISATAGSVRKSIHDKIAKIDTLSLTDLFKSSGGGNGGHAAAAHH